MKRQIRAGSRAGMLAFTREGDTVRFEIAWEDGSTDSGAADAVEVAPGRWSVLWNGASFDAIVEPAAVLVDGVRVEAESRDPRDWSAADAHAAASGPARIASPMPGKIVRLLVGEGDAVAEGQGIIVVEAMKMQNEMQAPRAGTVRSLRASPGATVAAGEVLATIE